MSEQQGRPVTAGQKQVPEVAYMLPHHPAEVDRLDVQHYLMLDNLGRNFVAPVERPARVLDVGSGTGQWGYDVCRQWADALVVGLDVKVGKPGAPPNYGMVRANLLRGLPFPDRTFDFVHQRFVASVAIPITRWPAVMRDLVRVTAPGGWIELVEGGFELRPAGPATERLSKLARQVGRSYSVDVDSVVVNVLGEDMRRAGVVDVTQQVVHVPVGEWAGRAGSLAATNARSLHLRLAEAYERLGVSQPQLHGLLREMRDECERLRSSARAVIAFGRRPTVLPV
jgi:SAM-dependent methyltransferase